jgi:hypothetical protein
MSFLSYPATHPHSHYHPLFDGEISSVAEFDGFMVDLTILFMGFS